MRDALAALYLLLFLPAWFIGIYYLVCSHPMNVYEALGVGTINGVFLAAFKDMWQFYFRKSPTITVQGG